MSYAAVIAPNSEGKYLTLFNKKIGDWEFPGGKIEERESPIAAAARALEEETGLEAQGLRLIGVFGHEGGQQWTGHYFLLESSRYVAQIMEPAKHTDLKYFNYTELVEKEIYPEHAAVKLVEDNDPLTFAEYSRAALTTASYPAIGNNVVYPSLGLAGESAELAERLIDLSNRLQQHTGRLADKAKHLWRDCGTMGFSDPNTMLFGAELHEAIVKESGDAQWYLAAIAHELGISLASISRTNLKKLQGRLARGTVKGIGDNR